MPLMPETNLLTGLEEVKETRHELKAVQAARMSTLAIALLTTVLTILSQ